MSSPSPPNRRHVRVGVVEAERRRPAQGRALLMDHPCHRGGVETLCAGAGLAEHTHRFDVCQAQSRPDRALQQRGVSVRSDRFHQAGHLAGAGQGKTESSRLALELWGKVDEGAEQDHHLRAFGEHAEQVS